MLGSKLMTQSGESLDTWRRRLLWRACHRGMRELDLLLGTFAREQLSTMGVEAMAELEKLLALPDGDLLDWIIGRRPVPNPYQGEIIEALKTLRFGPSGARPTG